MSQFDERYAKLNAEQKKAVDTIEGPLMVIAGPGSGKTELLSLRVANILRVADVTPGNILCLTFTDAAAFNMRERLAGLLGRDAYRVAIHTFHSFGAEVINRYPEHFYNGAIFLPADEVTQIETLQSIFDELDHDNPLSSKHDGQYVYIKQVKSAIEYLKKAGLTPNEYTQILAVNKKEAAAIDPLIQSVFADRVSKKIIPALQKIATELEGVPHEQLPGGFQPLGVALAQSLDNALAAAEESESTVPITEWKNEWTAKGDDKQTHLYDVLKSAQMTELGNIYKAYMRRMRENGYYDFNDMILDTIAMLEQNTGVRLDLQERYQYILVDEFQDTNDAQMRLVRLLTDNPVHEARPNIMVVGDDDQAIFKFQGAEISNIRKFNTDFRDVALVALKQNYRSTADILAAARHIVAKGTNALKNILPDVQKELRAANMTLKDGAIHSKEFATQEAEYRWVVREIGALVAKGVPMKEIAVISREHHRLEELTPYFHAAQIPIAYEREQNVLEEPHIRALVAMLRFIDSLMKKSPAADDLLPEILSYPFWEIPRAAIWELSVKAHRDHAPWLSAMLTSDKRLENIADFFIDLGAKATSATAEEILHELIGAPESEFVDEDGDPVEKPRRAYVSPFRAFYFGKKKFETQRDTYIKFLSSLQSFIGALREYHRGARVSTHDAIVFVDTHIANKLPIGNTSPFMNAIDAVRLTSAHKAKGLEFEAVFVMDCQEDVWASTRGNRRQFPLPSNLPIAPAGDTLDDQLRLFYVALTRAKRLLYLTSYRVNAKGKESSRLGFIAPGETAPTHFRVESVALDAMEATPESILSDALDMRGAVTFVTDEKALLQPLLESYQLSVTHLQNFLNVADAGPQVFLERNLLAFPEPKSPNSVFGSAMHSTIARIYEKLKYSGSLPELGEVEEWFTYYLQDGRLNDLETEKQLKRGLKVLGGYYPAKKATFSAEDRIEFNFKTQGVTIGDAHCTGKIDKLTTVEKEMVVVDFKTGKTISSWEPSDSHEKIKAWKYRQQLTFYKLLVEQSRDFGGTYTVNRGVIEFIEPVGGALMELPMDITPAEVTRLKKLIEVVYKKIITLDFPDVSKYPQDLSGIIAFEDDLLK